MNKILRPLAVVALGIFTMMALQAADTPEKYEMRSAWVATVWQLDWPQNVVSSTGNKTQIDRQKNDMIKMLDSLHVNNLNAVNFQVRSRCDAMYKSSYEPWSTDLVSTRGLDPGWDPLAFVVEECHKRGMECHAWINPYRFESVIGQWDGLPGDYRKDHPDWLLDVGSASILNPGRPEVTQRICDIIAEITRNYDIDGVLFDDYFYLSGTPMSQDADLYNAYKANGGTLSQGDWRRDNVNRMVAAVYKTIKDIKPWVRFGISPAGIACTSSSVARKYGISPCPTGSDWQYNDIYSDPIAWISQQSLDFISPQIYWTIGHSTDYDKAAKWWSEVAAKWNRHFFSSHSISSLTADSKAPGMSSLETDLAEPKASGPNNKTFEEYANEIRLNRQYTLNDAPGSIFYSCKYLYRIAPLFAHYLRTTVFNTPAIVPPMTWIPVSNPGNVSSVSRSGDKLSWKGLDNVRYTIYAVPTSVSTANFNRDAEYLLGVSYSTSYTIPEDRLSGYNYAVCVLDRYGNEYSPVFVGVATSTLDKPVLVSPAANEKVEMPFDFKWNEVKNATSYIIEIAEDAEMTKLLYTKPVNGTSVSSSEFYKMPIEKTIYWRVRSCGNSYNDGVSASQAFTALNLEITSPADGAAGIPVRTPITWTFPDRDVTIEIASDDTFEDGSIVYTAEATGGKHTVEPYNLAYCTQYFVRLHYTRNGVACTSPAVAFTTEAVVPEVPGIEYPVNGGTLYANDHIRVTPVEGVKAFRVEVSATTSFPSRQSYIGTRVDTHTFTDPKTGAEIRISAKGLEDGKTYYIRVRSQYQDEDGTQNGEYSTVTSFIYSSKTNAVDDIVVDEANAPAEYYDLRGIRVDNPAPGAIYIEKRGGKAEIRH